MDKEKLEQLEEIRSRYEARLDGSSSSGNWGHVGRPGHKGGSAPGGGGAFRLTYKNERAGGKKYTSQAKQRKEAQTAINDAKSGLKDAIDSGDKAAIAREQKRLKRAEKHASKINMNQKTRGSLNNYDPEASKNILADKTGRGAPATETRTTGVNGTREAIEYTYPKRIKDGQKTVNGKRGGQVKKSKKAQKEEEEWIPFF
jgi:hypothetical protein